MTEWKIRARPRESQVTAARFLLGRRAGLCVHATGTGKSLVQILTAFRLLKSGVAQKALFVVTKSSSIEVLGDFEKFTGQAPVAMNDRS